MEDNGTAGELNLDGATDISTKPSNYQTFLQQLNIDNNSTELFAHTHPNDKDISNSTIEVYQKNPPPYSETHFQHHEVESCRRSVIETIDPKMLSKVLELPEKESGTSSEFNDKLIWCEECSYSKTSDCAEHPPIVITDSQPLSFARQTLPPHFNIVTQSAGEYSVITNKRLRKHTRFGPLIGPLAVANAINSHLHTFKIFTGKDSYTYLNNLSEDSSNWMRFIRLAQNASEQNLIAYQHNGRIYFSSKCMISAGTELKVGFSESYALLMGVKPLSQTVEPEVAKKVIYKDGFPCESCEHVFIDFEALDAHVCSAEVAKQDAANKGRRTRNKRKGKPQKLSSAPKTKITPGDSKRNKLGGPKVSVVKKYQRPENTESVKCNDCDQVFNSRRRMEKHLFVHTGEHPYKCTIPVCPKTFNSKFKLDRHKLTHGSREFTCTHCGKSFARKDNLKAHLVVHDGSRQLFRCDNGLCGKVYSSKVSFKTHIALHKVEEGSLECYICHRLYDNAETLSLHIKVHAGSYKTKGIMEKKYKCSTCDKRFFASKDRDRHMLTHTKEKNFECNICLMKFSRSDHLKRHSLKVHPNGQKKPFRLNKTNSKSDKEELPELSATDFTRSIQQIFGDANLPIEATSVGTELTVPNTTVQIAPMLNSGLHHRPVLQSDQRVNTNGFLNILTNSGNQAIKQAQSTWQPQTADAAVRYVLSNDTISQSDGGMARYYITGDTIRLPSDSQVTTYLLPSESSQTTNVNLDSIPRQSSLMDSSHTLPSDSLSNDFTADGMKVLTGLTPIFLNPDGTTTDTDLIPMVYQTNPQ